MLAAVITCSDDRERPETANEFVTQRSHSAYTLVHLVCNGLLCAASAGEDETITSATDARFCPRVVGSMRLPRGTVTGPRRTPLDRAAESRWPFSRARGHIHRRGTP